MISPFSGKKRKEKEEEKKKEKHLWRHITAIQKPLSLWPADESLALLSFGSLAVPHIRPILPSHPRRM